MPRESVEWITGESGREGRGGRRMEWSEHRESVEWRAVESGTENGGEGRGENGVERAS